MPFSNFVSYRRCVRPLASPLHAECEQHFTTFPSPPHSAPALEDYPEDVLESLEDFKPDGGGETRYWIRHQSSLMPPILDPSWFVLQHWDELEDGVRTSSIILISLEVAHQLLYKIDSNWSTTQDLLSSVTVPFRPSHTSSLNPRLRFWKSARCDVTKSARWDRLVFVPFQTFGRSSKASVFGRADGLGPC